MRAAFADTPVNHHQAAARTTAARRARAERAARARLAVPPDTVVARLAEFIVTRAAGIEGNCTEQDLRQAGFTEDDLQRHLPEARRRAARQAPGLQGGA